MARTDQLTPGMVVVTPRYGMFPPAPPRQVETLSLPWISGTNRLITVVFTDGSRSDQPVNAEWTVAEVVS
jgi:hypothetical protein